MTASTIQIAVRGTTPDLPEWRKLAALTREQAAGMTVEELQELPIEELDRAAYGFAEGDVLTLDPEQIAIVYDADLENAEAAVTSENADQYVKFGGPVEIAFRDGRLVLEDGHHRWVAAKILGRRLRARVVSIDDNPVLVLSSRQAAAGAPAVLYHGTSEAGAQGIAEAGLQPGAYVARDPDAAWRFADGVVLEVDAAGLAVVEHDAWSGAEPPAGADVVLDPEPDGYGVVQRPIDPERIRRRRTAAAPDLEALVADFLQQREVPFDPACATETKGRCDGIATDLYYFLEDHGVASEVVEARGLKRPLPPTANAEWIEFVGNDPKNLGYLSHVVVQVGNQIVDLTGAQFGLPSGVVPLASFRANWRELRPFGPWPRPGRKPTAAFAQTTGATVITAADVAPVTRGLYPYLRDRPLDVAQHGHLVPRMFPDALAEIGVTPEQWEEAREQSTDEYYEMAQRLEQALSAREKEELVSNLMQHDPVEAPSWGYLSGPRLVRPDVWLVHFTDEAGSIKQEGFTRGIEDLTRLGLTTYMSEAEKKYGGYNFAFRADSRDARNVAREQKYGEHAVLFRAVGVEAWHSGDEENQVIVWGKSVPPDQIVELTRLDSEWGVAAKSKSRMQQRGRDFAFQGTFEDCVSWVEQNFGQYHRQIAVRVTAADLGVPKVRQQTGYTCGPAALRAVLGYYGMRVPEAEAAEEADTDHEDGTSPEDLAQAAEEYGLTAELRTGMTLEDLAAAVSAGTPAIVAYQAWREDDDTTPWRDDWHDGHYAVVIEVDAENVHVEDPSLDEGRGVIPRAEFMERWHDVDGGGTPYNQLGIVVRRAQARRGAAADEAGDVVVTLPRGKLKEWLEEGAAAGAPPNGMYYAWHMGGHPPKRVAPGSRVYVVYDGHLIGWAVLERVEQLPGGGYNLIRSGEASAVTIDAPCPGFRGYRYRWWPREAERPFPEWTRLAARDAGEAIVWHGLKIVLEARGGQRRPSGDGQVLPKSWRGLGYFEGLTDKNDEDEQELDVVIGDGDLEGDAFLVVQLDRKGRFRQFKVELGFADEAQAEAAFKLLWRPGTFGGIWTVPAKRFRKLVLPRLTKEAAGSADGAPRFMRRAMLSMEIDPRRITPPHRVKNVRKKDRLVEALRTEGWNGRPLLIYKSGGQYQAITGSHRLAAAVEAELARVPVLLVEDADFTPETYTALDEATDNYDRLRALEDLRDERPATHGAYELMLQEVAEKNKVRRFTRSSRVRAAERGLVGWIDPQDRLHSTGAGTHAQWAALHIDEVGVPFPGPWYDSQDNEVPREEADYDAQGRTASDALFDAGWIRLHGRYIEVPELTPPLAKRLARWLRDNTGLQTAIIQEQEGGEYYYDRSAGRIIPAAEFGRTAAQTADAAVERLRAIYAALYDRVLAAGGHLDEGGYLYWKAPNSTSSAMWSRPERAIEQMLDFAIRRRGVAREQAIAELEEYLTGEMTAEVVDFEGAAEENLARREQEEREQRLLALGEELGGEEGYVNVYENLPTSGMVWAWHGTSTALLPSIMEEGLRPEKTGTTWTSGWQAGGVTEGVFLELSGDSRQLDFYARRAAGEHGGEPVILRVLVDAADLEPDPDDADISAGRTQVIHRGPIAPSQIYQVGGEWVREARLARPFFGVRVAAEDLAEELDQFRDDLTKAQQDQAVQKATQSGQAVQQPQPTPPTPLTPPTAVTVTAADVVGARQVKHRGPCKAVHPGMTHDEWWETEGKHFDDDVPAGDRWHAAGRRRAFYRQAAEDQPYVVEVAPDGTKAWVRHHAGEYRVPVPVSAVESIRTDLAQEPPALGTGSGNAAVDAVLSGQGTPLGRGNDSVAWRVGDQIVKLMSTVPYQPLNPGYRTLEQTVENGRAQAAMAAKIGASAAAGTVAPVELVEHEGRAFLVQPALEVPTRLDAEQLKAAQLALQELHRAGFALQDEVQFGFTPDGRAQFFDLGGMTDKPGQYSLEDDRSSMRRKYRDYDVPYVPADDEFMARWRQYEAQVRRWVAKGRPVPAHLKGPEYEALIQRANEERLPGADEISDWVIWELPLHQAMAAPGARLFHGTTEQAAQAILAEGARGAEGGRGWSAPMAGRLYLTADMGTALIYALGANMVGRDLLGGGHPQTMFTGRGAVVKFRQTGGVAIPDEDWLASYLALALDPENKSAPLPYEAKKVWREEGGRLAREIVGALPTRAYESLKGACKRGEWYPYCRAGKAVINALKRTQRGRELLARAAELSPNVAVEPGDLEPVAAWSFDKIRDNPKLLPDGSNFFQVAAPMPGQQREAGRRQAADEPPHRRATWRGLPIVLEHVGGETRFPEGQYPAYLPSDWVGYGYFEGLEADDGDSLDVIVGPDPFGEVYLAVQCHPETQEFFQFKVMLGFEDEAAAEAGFRLLWPAKMFAGITTIPLEEFREVVLPKLSVNDENGLPASEAGGSAGDAGARKDQDAPIVIDAQDVFDGGRHAAAKPKVLLAGFEPFGGEPRNVAGEVVESIGLRPPKEIELRTAVLPVGPDAPNLLLSAISDFDPEVVFVVGESDTTTGFEIERRTRSGTETSADLDEIVKALPGARVDDGGPGDGVCNEVYEAALGTGREVVFVHVPDQAGREALTPGIVSLMLAAVDRLSGAEGRSRQAFADADVATANATYRDKGCIGANPLVYQWLRENVPAREAGTVLDFGAGRRAVHTKRLRSAGYDVTGWEFGDNFDPEIHDGDALARMYDTVLAGNVLNVQASEAALEETLKQLLGAVGPGGRLIANLPAEPRKHDVPADKLEATIEKAGFTVEDKSGGSAPLWVFRRGAPRKAMPLPRDTDLPRGWHLETTEDLFPQPERIGKDAVHFQLLDDQGAVVATATIERLTRPGVWQNTAAYNWRPEGPWGAYVMQKALEYVSARGEHLAASDNVSPDALQVVEKMHGRPDVESAPYMLRRRIKKNTPEGGEWTREEAPALWQKYRLKQAASPSTAPMVLQHVPRQEATPDVQEQAHQSIMSQGWDPRMHGKTTKALGGHRYLAGPKGTSFTPIADEMEVRREGSPVFAVGAFSNPLAVTVEEKAELPERYGAQGAALTRKLTREGHDALLVMLGNDVLEVIAFEPNKLPRFSTYAAAAQAAQVGHIGRTAAGTPTGRPQRDDYVRSSRLEELPVVDEETWPDGTVVTWLQSPFPYERKPAVPSRLIEGAKVESVPLNALVASQAQVTRQGVEQYLGGRDEGLPLVYEENGKYYVGDGHHRLVAAWARGQPSAPARVVHLSSSSSSSSRMAAAESGASPKVPGAAFEGPFVDQVDDHVRRVSFQARDANNRKEIGSITAMGAPDGTLTIKGVFVDRPWSKKGLADALYALVFRWAKEHGDRWVRPDTTLSSGAVGHWHRRYQNPAFSRRPFEGSQPTVYNLEQYYNPKEEGFSPRDLPEYWDEPSLRQEYRLAERRRSAMPAPVHGRKQTASLEDLANPIVTPQIYELDPRVEPMHRRLVELIQAAEAAYEASDPRAEDLDAEAAELEADLDALVAGLQEGEHGADWEVGTGSGGEEELLRELAVRWQWYTGEGGAAMTPEEALSSARYAIPDYGGTPGTDADVLAAMKDAYERLEALHTRPKVKAAERLQRAAKAIVGDTCPWCGEVMTERSIYGSGDRWFHRGCPRPIGEAQDKKEAQVIRVGAKDVLFTYGETPGGERGSSFAQDETRPSGAADGPIGRAATIRVTATEAMEPVVRLVGRDFPSKVLHGTTRASARAFARGEDLPESSRKKTLSEWGSGVVYVSERRDPHQALMFAEGPDRTLVELDLRPGARILDVSHELVRRPYFGREFPAETRGRPSWTGDMSAWLNEARARHGAPPLDEARLEVIDPTSSAFSGSEYLPMLANYARDRGFAGVRTSDETVIVDRSAITGARVLKTPAQQELKEKPRRTEPERPGTLYAKEPEPVPPEAYGQEELPFKEPTARVAVTLTTFAALPMGAWFMFLGGEKKEPLRKTSGSSYRPRRGDEVFGDFAGLHVMELGGGRTAALGPPVAPEALPEELYHVTTADRLPYIEQAGLSTAGPPVFAGGQESHSQLGLFMSGPQSVRFWHGRVPEHAEYRQGEASTGTVPVVLRFSRDALNGTVYADPDGNRDTYSQDNYIYQGTPVGPDDLEYWTGTAWAYLPESAEDPLAVEEFDIGNLYETEVDEGILRELEEEEGATDPNDPRATLFRYKPWTGGRTAFTGEQREYKAGDRATHSSGVPVKVIRKEDRGPGISMYLVEFLEGPRKGHRVPASPSALKAEGKVWDEARARSAARVPQGALRGRIETLRPQLAAAAQQVVDAWMSEVDEEGFDVELGGGGPCDEVAQAMAGVLSSAGIDVTDGGHDGDDHAWLIAYDDQEACGVDVPPSVYETGGGYAWQKRQEAAVSPEDVEIWPINRADLGHLDDDDDRRASTRITAAEVEAQARPKTKPAAASQLAAVHNLSAGNLIHAAEIGGLIAPSIAVVNTTHPFTNFGEITLVAPMSLVDPARTPVYDADIYSPRYPTVYREPHGKNVGKFLKEHEPYAARTKTYTSDIEHVIEYEGGPDRVLENLKAPLRLRFLEQVKGQQVEDVMRTVPLDPEWVSAPSMQQFFSTHGRDVNADWDSPYWAEMSAAAQQAIREFYAPLEPEMRDDIIESAVEHYFRPDGRMFFGPGNRVLRVAGNVGKTEVDQYAVRNKLEALIAPYEVEFEAWARPQVEALAAKQYMKSPGGRKMQYNPGNVLKLMAPKQIKGQEGFHYGLGTLRAQGAHKFRSLDQMEQAADRLIPHEEMEALKEQNRDEFFSLVEQLGSYHPAGGDFRFTDTVLYSLGESFKRGRSLWNELKRDGFRDVPPHLVQALQEFGQKLVNMPTEYFEAKPRRIVALQEFVGAVVPSDVSALALEVLARHGLETATYDSADEASRAAAVQQLAGSARTAAVVTAAGLVDLQGAADKISEALAKAAQEAMRVSKEMKHQEFREPETPASTAVRLSRAIARRARNMLGLDPGAELRDLLSPEVSLANAEADALWKRTRLLLSDAPQGKAGWFDHTGPAIVICVTDIMEHAFRANDPYEPTYRYLAQAFTRTVAHELRHAADWAYQEAVKPGMFSERNPGLPPDRAFGEYLNKPTELLSWAGNVANAAYGDVGEKWRGMNGGELWSWIKDALPGVFDALRPEYRADFLQRVVTGLEQLSADNARRIEQQRQPADKVVVTAADVAFRPGRGGVPQWIAPGTPIPEWFKPKSGPDEAQLIVEQRWAELPAEVLAEYPEQGWGARFLSWTETPAGGAFLLSPKGDDLIEALVAKYGEGVFEELPEAGRIATVRRRIVNSEAAVVTLRVPGALARLWPEELTARNGAPHFTLAYVPGPHDDEAVARLQSVVAAVAAKTPPLPIELAKGVHWFESDNPEAQAKGEPWIAHKTVHPETAERMTALHWALVGALEQAGFAPSAHAEFSPHSTLAYCPERGAYDGPSPEGGWTADAIEVEREPDAPVVYRLAGSRPVRRFAELVAAELEAAGIEPGRRIVVAAGPVIDMAVSGGDPIKKRKKWIGETYYRPKNRERSTVVYATREGASTGDTSEVRLKPDAKVLREGGLEWLRMFADGLPKLVDIMEKAVEGGYDAVRIGEALAILSGVAIADQDDEAKRQKRLNRPRGKGWAGA